MLLFSSLLEISHSPARTLSVPSMAKQHPVVHDSVEISHPDTIDPGHTDPGQEDAPTKPTKTRSQFMRGLSFWSFLIVYTICCIALSVILVKVINGFNAAESTTPRYINGKLQLRVADITTLISAGLVVIKYVLISILNC